MNSFRRFPFRPKPRPIIDLNAKFWPGGRWALTDRDEHLKPIAELAQDLDIDPERIRTAAQRLRLPVAGPHPETPGFEDGAVLREDEQSIRKAIAEEGR